MADPKAFRLPEACGAPFSACPRNLAKVRGLAQHYRADLVSSNSSSFLATRVRLLTGSIRLTIARAVRTLNPFGHSSSGSARNSCDRAGVR